MRELKIPTRRALRRRMSQGDILEWIAFLEDEQQRANPPKPEPTGRRRP